MTLHLVATPLGNLDDLSPRIVKTLLQADLILCEDTRSLVRLLPHRKESLEKEQRILSYHRFNEAKACSELLEELRTLEVALISDAGTPAIADPGATIVAACHREGIAVRSVGTLCAFAASFSCSGWSGDLLFQGFIPKKKEQCRALIEQLFSSHCDARLLAGDLSFPIYAFYVSPHQIEETLELLCQLAARYYGKHPTEISHTKDALDSPPPTHHHSPPTPPYPRLQLSKEISKIHEQHRQGALLDLSWLEAMNRTRGEFVMLLQLEPSSRQHEEHEEPKREQNPKYLLALKLTRSLRQEGLPLRRAAKIAATTFNLSANTLYQICSDSRPRSTDSTIF